MTDFEMRLEFECRGCSPTSFELELLVCQMHVYSNLFHNTDDDTIIQIIGGTIYGLQVFV